MKRVIKSDEIHLAVDGVEAFSNDRFHGFVIAWSSDVGFGEYTVYRKKDSQEWLGDSEHMDCGNNKEFLKELLRLFVEKIIIKG